MALYDIGIFNGKAYIDGYLVRKNLYIQGEKIVAISSDVFECNSVYDAKDRWILPGFIDPHVHFELNVGAYTSADDFKTGSVAAALQQ
jgi:dihydropyrimidinase